MQHALCTGCGQEACGRLPGVREGALPTASSVTQLAGRSGYRRAGPPGLASLAEPPGRTGNWRHRPPGVSSRSA